MRLTTITAVLLTLTIVCPIATAADWIPRTVRAIIDGDTLLVESKGQKTTLRLAEIDAPEKDQPFGVHSRTALLMATLEREIRFQPTKKDDSNQTVALVRYGKEDINRRMVAMGLAWACPEKPKESPLSDLQAKAKKARRGLWGTHQKPIPPSDWRKQNRSKPDCEKPQPDDLPNAGGKYWLNTSSGTRHNSDCPYFNNTKKGRLCKPDEGKPCKTCGG
jgi:endonuclease YncB( thermonuclease family)